MPTDKAAASTSLSSAHVGLAARAASNASSSLPGTACLIAARDTLRTVAVPSAVATSASTEYSQQQGGQLKATSSPSLRVEDPRCHSTWCLAGRLKGDDECPCLSRG